MEEMGLNSSFHQLVWRRHSFLLMLFLKQLGVPCGVLVAMVKAVCDNRACLLPQVGLLA
jgi:hypothetical protein